MCVIGCVLGQFVSREHTNNYNNTAYTVFVQPPGYNTIRNTVGNVSDLSIIMIYEAQEFIFDKDK